MENNPKISIITASYNYENYIKETIESVLNQDYSNWEFVIVDDGSKDNSLEVIKSYQEKDERIKLYTHPNNENRGLKETIKLGLEKSNGEWIAFLESDDIFTKDCLSKKVEVMKNYPEVNFIFSDLELFGDEERINTYYKEYFLKQKKILSKKPKIIKHFSDDFINKNYIPTFSCVILKKELFKNVDFETVITSVLDYWLWLQILSEANAFYLNEKLTKWRIHKSFTLNDNYSRQTGEVFNFLKRKLLLKRTKNIFTKLNIYMYFFKIKRRKYVAFSAKHKYICLFGKKFNFNNKNEEN